MATLRNSFPAIRVWTSMKPAACCDQPISVQWLLTSGGGVKTLTIAFFSLATVVGQTKRPMTPDDVMAVKSVNNARISPDGKLALYEVAYPDLKDDQGRNEIWIAPAGAPMAGLAKPRKFTSGRDDRSPEWSPDGQSVAFLGARSAAAAAPATPPGERPRAQIYVMPTFGGGAEALNDEEGGVRA